MLNRGSSIAWSPLFSPVETITRRSKVLAASPATFQLVKESMFHTDSFLVYATLSVAGIRKPEQPPPADYVTREHDSSAQK